MPYARWKRVGLSVVLAGAIAWLLARDCGSEAPPSAGVGAGAELDAEAAAEPGAVAGDPLLRRARAGIRAGSLPEALWAEMLGSTAPEHARAQRVLSAMTAPPPGAEDRSADVEGPNGGHPRPPPILPPSEAEAAVLPVPSKSPQPAGSGPSDTEPRSSSAGADRPPRPKAHAEVGGLALRTSKDGATLIINASSSLVVGVANQPASGIVRLMIDAADAGTSVLTARPRTEGAAVTGVRKGQGTVQITVKLEPGWRFGSVQPFSGGAKVHLVAPP
jgi:hypothetical protein